MCGGLVIEDKKSNIIRLVHYTTQQYFEKTKMKWFPNAEINITMACITYLSFSTFERGFCVTDDEYGERLRSNPLYEYAAQNWGYHACDARDAQIEIGGLILAFLKSDHKVSSSIQALMVSRSHKNYSQMFPGHLRGVHLTAIFGLKEATVTLLKNGNDLNLKDTNFRVPLSYTAEYRHEAVVKALLEKGTNLESKDKYGRTPLNWAAVNSHEAVIKLLLDNDADLDCKDNIGRTPLL